MHDMAKDLIKRQKYVKDICQFCITNQLQGVDLDWESYPIPVNEANFLSFIQELSAELHPKNLKLTVAVDVSQAALTMRFINYTDQVNLMAYGILDPNGNHATLSMLSAWLSSFRQSGIPFNKIIAGVPFYAKRPKISGDTSPTSIVYRSIPEPYLQDAAATRYGNYSFNSRNMMKDKTIYLMENLCAGIMSWELTQDFAPGSEYSLLKAIYDEYGKLLNP